MGCCKRPPKMPSKTGVSRAEIVAHARFNHPFEPRLHSKGDAWILLYRRRRMGRVIPDKERPGMWRSVKVDGNLSDTANLCWSKDNVMAQVIREVAWDAANDPRKCPVKRGSREQKSPPMRLNAA